MSNLNLQFHATKQELIAATKEWVKSNNLFMVCIQLSPLFTCELVGRDKFDEKKKVIENSDIISLYRFEPDVTSKSYLEFVKSNENGLIITMGKQEEDTLKESIISTSATDECTSRLWRKVVNNFKKEMLKGAWVVNPHNGAKEFYKNHYYTISAKKAYDKGAKVVAFAGWNTFLLDNYNCI